MLACITKGVVTQAWIFDVLGPDMLIAEKGGGAFRNGERLQVSAGLEMSDMHGHINPGYFPKDYKNHIRDARAKFKSCESLNCAAHEYLRIATGRSQFSLYSRLKPWDHLPGSLIVQEAGGYVAQWDGSPYTPKDKDVGLIVAASKDNWQTVYDAFLKGIIP